MIVYSNRHYLLGVFLSYYIFIQFRFDLMRSRNILDIQDRFFFFFRLFLFHTLALRDLCIHVSKSHHRSHVHKLAVIHPAKIHIVHCIKAFLHTVRTHADIIRKIDHLSGHTLRSVTDEADLFIAIFVIFFFVCIFYLTGYFLNCLVLLVIFCHWLVLLFSVVFRRFLCPSYSISTPASSINSSSEMIGTPSSFAFLFLEEADSTSLLIR